MDNHPAPAGQPVTSEHELDDLAGLIHDFGEQWWISRRPSGWSATPKPLPNDVLTAADPDSLRGRLERATAQRDVTDL